MEREYDLIENIYNKALEKADTKTDVAVSVMPSKVGFYFFLVSSSHSMSHHTMNHWKYRTFFLAVLRLVYDEKKYVRKHGFIKIYFSEKQRVIITVNIEGKFPAHGLIWSGNWPQQ
jgi:hypothetical protein